MMGVADPSASSPSTSTPGPPIMKSTWTDEWLTPFAIRSSAPSPSTLDGERQAAAVGDVAGRVLVEERVREHEPRLAHPGRAVDERDLAEVGRALVGRELGADHLCAVAVRLHVAILPPSKLISRPSTRAPTPGTISG